MLLKIGEHEMTLKLNIAQVKRVREKTGFDLLMKRDPKALMNELSDQERVAEIIAVLLQPEFERCNIDETGVYELFDGATLKAASDAFFAELISFFAAMGRTAAATALTKITETWALMETKTVELVNRTAETLSAEVNSLQLPSGPMSTAAPGSPESIPPDSPSGN
jgi:hypothetical protein